MSLLASVDEAQNGARTRSCFIGQPMFRYGISTGDEDDDHNDDNDDDDDDDDDDAPPWGQITPKELQTARRVHVCVCVCVCACVRAVDETSPVTV